MINVVDLPPFLRSTLHVAMETMHFHITKTCFYDNFVSHIGGQNEQLAPREIDLGKQRHRLPILDVGYSSQTESINFCT